MFMITMVVQGSYSLVLAHQKDNNIAIATIWHSQLHKTMTTIVPLSATNLPAPQPV